MICSTCGTQLPDDLKFCTLCGTAINNSAPNVGYRPMEDRPTELFNEAPPYEPVSYNAPNYQYDNSYTQTPPSYQPSEPMYNQAPGYNQAPMYNQAPPVYQPAPLQGQYSYQTFADPYAGLEPPKRDPGKVCGILSLIFSLVGYPTLILYGSGLFFWLAALILGAIGKSASKRAGFSNGRAKAGIIITLLPLIISVIIGVIALVVFLIAALLGEI